ncbi:GGDEF domain-containing protein [bacterium]|nr:GGDEF domain-containing protein [bacterium]
MYRVLVDEETGLYNFQYLMERLQQEINYVSRFRQELVFCLVEVAGLDKLSQKEAKDRRCKVAEFLTDFFRDYDVVARVDDTKFGVIVRSISYKNATKRAEVLMEEFKKRFPEFSDMVYIALVKASEEVLANNVFDRAIKALRAKLHRIGWG